MSTGPSEEKYKTLWLSVISASHFFTVFMDFGCVCVSLGMCLYDVGQVNAENCGTHRATSSEPDGKKKTQKMCCAREAAADRHYGEPVVSRVSVVRFHTSALCSFVRLKNSQRNTHIELGTKFKRKKKILMYSTVDGRRCAESLK